MCLFHVLSNEILKKKRRKERNEKRTERIPSPFVPRRGRKEGIATKGLLRVRRMVWFSGFVLFFVFLSF
jgi:hypothetical protein